jgi:CRP/FNR family transcriptional regulator, cyclic AMP receptor protein
MNNLELLSLMHVHAPPRRWDEPTLADWADVLATVPLFTGVRKRRLRRLARNATLAEFAAGEPIISPGDPGNWLYIILSGHAKTRSRGGERVLRSGDYFGELALIDGRPRSATLVAVSDVHMMKLPSPSVRRLARRCPAIALTMLRDLTAQLRRLEIEGARAA